MDIGVNLSACPVSSGSPNLIPNGDFEQGPGTFQSDYTYCGSGPETYGSYMVGSNPNTYNPGWCSMSNHTSGGSKMLIVDGSTDINDRFWFGVVNVTPNKAYKFTYWCASLYSLGYDNKDNAFTNNQLNGQVQGQMWCTQGDDAQRKYEYTYDAANRLTNAAFNEQTAPGSGWKNTSTDFSTTASYNYNGNLLTMVQKGVVPGNTAPIQIDNLAYTYLSLSNKLSRVTDNTTAGSNNGVGGDFKDGTNAAGTADYVYDANGNIITDLNKAIGTSAAAGIFYNYLDKPTQINIAGKGTVNFVYDANGNKLQKKFTPTSGSAITTTYINEFVYQAVGSATPSLQYINFEEGRVRIVTPVSQSTAYGGVTTDALTISALLSMPNSKQGAMDFFIRDYQQNVRMLLTEEVHTGYNTCTMETARNTLEDGIFQGSGNEVENTRSGKPAGWNSNTSTSVSKLGDASGTPQVGPNAFLKVMAGDVINATSDYYYQAPVGNTAGATALTQSIINSILGSITGGSVASPLVGHNTAAINTALQPGTNAPFLAITQPDQTATGTVPKAFLTVMFFDERFNFVSGNVQRVSQSGDGASQLVLANIQAPKNGYAYAYLSNESAEPVYFDNFKVGLNHGRIIEEDHYYAFGLKIAGISSTKLPDNNEGYVTNKNLYNDKEIADEADLDWYDYGFRNYDAQIGRFVQMDPLTDNLSDLSPYHYAYNDPIGNTDFNGLIPCPGTSALTIFLGKAGEAISHALGAIGPIENVLSIADHIAGTTSLIMSATLLNQQINNWNTDAVGQVKNNLISLGFGSGAGDGNGNDDNWQDLYKEDLKRFYFETMHSKGSEYLWGKVFENLFGQYVNDDPILSGIANVKFNPENVFGDNIRNTKPDFIGDAIYGSGTTAEGKVIGAHWYELKQKGGGLYLSTQDGQIEGHIDNLAREFAEEKNIYEKYKFQPLLTVITTADVKLSPSIIKHANSKQVLYEHIHAEFRKTKSGWEFRFNKRIGANFIF